MNKEPELNIAAQVVPLAKISINPWGDCNRIVVITFRSKDKSSTVSKYFKICDETHYPFELTEEEFKTACVQTLLVNSGLPLHIQL